MDMPLPTLPYPASQLLARKRTHVAFAPDAPTRAAMAEALGLLELPAFRFEAEVGPETRSDLRLTGKLTARVVQACIVSLAPVPSRIEETVVRRFLADWQEPTGDEVEIPEDDTAEPLPAVIDIAAVAIEALSLALPLYPRAPGAELGAQEFPPPDATPAGDGGRKPLAGLAALMARKTDET